MKLPTKSNRLLPLLVFVPLTGILSAQSITQPATEQTRQILVLNAVNSQSIAGARVSCGSAKSLTEASGAAALPLSSTTNCRWAAAKEGYYFDPGAQPKSNPASSSEPIQLRLTPYSEVRGRLLNRERQPLAGIQVQLLTSLKIGSQRSAAGSHRATTDAAGVFRFTNVQPGSYILLALPPVANDRPDSGYQLTVYPSGDDISQALPFTVKAGATLSDMDIELTKAETFTLAGEITGLEETEIPASRSWLELHFLPRNSSLVPNRLDPFEATLSMNSRRIPLTTGKRIRLSGLVPGKYRLKLFADNSLSSSTTFEVLDRNIDQFQLQAWNTPPLSGRLSFDLPDAPPLPPNFLLSLLNADNGISMRSLSVAEDGRIRFGKLPPGRYRVAVSSPASRWFVSNVSLKQKSIAGATFDIDPGYSDSIDVVLSARFASVQFHSDTPGSLVTLVPQSRTLFEGDLIRVGPADASGRFTADNVAPGSYIACAWINATDRIVAVLLNDSLPSRVQQNCEEFQISPAGRKTLTLKAVEFTDSN